MAEDGVETNEETRGTKVGNIIGSGPGLWQLCFKFVELVFCIVSVALLSAAAEQTFFRIKIQFHHIILAYASFVGYIIISLILIITRLLREPIGLRASFLYSIVGAGLFFVTSIFLFVDKSYLENYIAHTRNDMTNTWIACACFALFNALVFVADTVYTFLKRDNFD